MSGPRQDGPLPSVVVTAPAKVDSNEKDPDPGLRSQDHYERALPNWRYKLRQQALPLIRWETPYLAWMQKKLRTPALDSYFAITANLGTHTFFMFGLPLCFWFGYPALGKGLVHMLALGVFWSGFVKDFFSLPRPLSPPLQRITMSGSVSLEYGFPSTHSANAISVAVYSLMLLHDPENALQPMVKLALEILCYVYSISILFGRLYCGMHGFLDVLSGSLLGAVIGVFEYWYGPPLDEYVHSSSWLAPIITGFVIIALIRIHPEPADDCPCFDDSVAFAGVVIGVDGGTWSYGKIPNDPWDSFSGAENHVNVAILGWTFNILRVVVGVLTIIAWREIMKPLLLKSLPHLFRLIEEAGLILPRRFFTPASEYKTVPTGDQMDTIFPRASDFPRIVESIRHPTTRGRSVSVGPQSAADAYEALAYRERQRRDSVNSNSSLRSKSSLMDMATEDRFGSTGQTSGAQKPAAQQDSAQGKLGEGTVSIIAGANGAPDIIIDQEEDRLEEEKEVFARLIRPRVRYDVEVVTKLVVYAGIGWFAAAGVPLMYEFSGLGTNHLLQ